MTVKTPSLFSSGEVSGEADEGGILGADPSRSRGELDVPGFDTIGPSGVETGEGFSAGDTLESFGSDQFCSEPVFGVMDESTLDSLVAESADGSEGQQHEILDEELYPPGDVNAAGSQTQPSGPTDSFVDVDLDSCVNAALISIPLQLPKPIWDDGVWEAIFGTGTFMTVDQLTPSCQRPAVFPTLEAWLGQIEDSSRVLKRKAETVVCESYSDVVKHLPVREWQEERESLLQAALKRWLVTVISFSETSLIWQQISVEGSDVKKLAILADVFSGKAPTTLLKRVRAVEKLVSHLGVGNFPAKEPEFYKLFQSERENGAPASRLKSYLESLAFCLHIFGMDELKEVVQSRRLHGATVAATPANVVQASPLSVSELQKLHDLLWGSAGWDAAFAGSVLFCVYSRARWSDAMHCCNLILDKDDKGTTQFLEGETAVHKSMHAEIYRHRFLPLVAPSMGVAVEPWVDRWMLVRECLGIQQPPSHPVMPAPSADGTPCVRALSATEAGDWLRKILTGTKEHTAGRRVTAHSMKSTCLSFCAKFGLTAEVRLQLGYHVAGFKMLHTYSRDAAAQPLLELARVLGAIREGTFLPDVTRSGRFVEPLSSEPAVTAHTAVVVEVDTKEESMDLTSEVIPSSSSESSSEEFQTDNTRVFLPPVPPAGYVFWQHKKLKTLHLALPEYKRVFMCNRYMGAQHIKEGMSIRYDTPVCRQCISATRA